MDFDIISFVLGGFTGFTGALVIGRARFARLQNLARDLTVDLRNTNVELASERRARVAAEAAIPVAKVTTTRSKRK